ncbi:MAG: hypothetical protein OXI69_05945 [Acidobacteriota bacterium]|nr:hypothetical protein [Acidobacteriota bacterium]
MAKARSIVEALRRAGVTDLVGLPDNSSAALFSLLKDGGEPVIRLVTREGEAFAMAAGLWMGGRVPAVLIQNTGLLESGDSFRGTVLRMRIPLLCLITFRGYAKLERVGPRPGKLDPHLLSRPDVDSAALLTEPTLQAWGLPFDYLHEEQDVPKVKAWVEKAHRLSTPVALLVTRDMNSD